MASDAPSPPPRRDPTTAGDSLLGRLNAAIAPRGRPPRPVWDLLWMGLRSQRRGIVVGLVCTYAPVIPAILVATGGAAAGGGYEATTTIPVPDVAQGAIHFFAALGGAVVGGLFGFVLALSAAVRSGWGGAILKALATGALIALGLTLIIILGERRWLSIRGYRRMSWEEEERILPLAQGAAQALEIDIDRMPVLMIADQKTAGAWSHCTALVLTSYLLNALDNQELKGILAHELYHWKAGHVVGQWLVWSCTFPLAIAYNIGARVGRENRSPFLGLLAWCITWPIWVIIRVFIIPAQAKRLQENEYVADAATCRAGADYREGLRAALRKLAVFKPGRTGWEAATAARHPPTALRIERLISVDEAQLRAAILVRRAEERAARHQDHARR